MKMKLYQNVRGAEARARSFDLSCAELRSHSPKTLFFAMKNTDFVVANILCENDAIRKYARRWGQSTILRILLPRAATSCSQNHIFYKEKRWSCTRPKSRWLLASRWTPGRPEASAAEFLRFGPTKAPRACSKNLIFHKENWGFHVLRYYDGSSHDTKICTALRPEDDFRNDALKPEKVMLPKALFFARKIEDLVLPGIMIAHVII